jgi:hypothetical protein
MKTLPGKSSPGRVGSRMGLMLLTGCVRTTCVALHKVSLVVSHLEVVETLLIKMGVPTPVLPAIDLAAIATLVIDLVQQALGKVARFGEGDPDQGPPSGQVYADRAFQWLSLIAPVTR